MAKNPRLIDMQGQKIGMWSVGAQAGNSERGAALWMCKCECGNEAIVAGADLRAGKSISCGCRLVNVLGDHRRTHGESGTRIHRIWVNMRKRCNNPKNPGFENYGGRGISICREWNEFSVFRDWALQSGYDDALSIERKDVDGDYTPENCTWADALTQSSNRRYTQKADDGDLWWHKAKANGISRPAFTWRKAQGWPMDLVVSWPQGKRRAARERDEKGHFI